MKIKLTQTFFQTVNALVVSVVIAVMLSLIFHVEAVILDPATDSVAPSSSVVVNVYSYTAGVTVDAMNLRLLINNGTITDFTSAFTNPDILPACGNGALFDATTHEVCADYGVLIADNTLLGTLTLTVGTSGTTTVDKVTGNEYYVNVTATPDPAVPTVGAGTATPTPYVVVRTTPDINGLATDAGAYIILAATLTPTATPIGPTATPTTETPTSTPITNTTVATVTPTTDIKELPITGVSSMKLNYNYLGLIFVLGGIAVSISNKVQTKTI